MATLLKQPPQCYGFFILVPTTPILWSEHFGPLVTELKKLWKHSNVARVHSPKLPLVFLLNN